jgi:uncharacterized protein YcfL
MKKKSLLWISVLLLMLAGCSNSDDEIAIYDRNILGYWESTGSIDGRCGLLFVSNGEIKYWDSLLYCTRQFSEVPWGYFWFDDDGTLKIQNRKKDSAPNPDEMYYKVMSLTKDRLVIRIFGGFAGTSLEEGSEVEYKKTDKPNK